MILRSNLPHEYPRRYLAASFDAGDPTSVMKQFDELSTRAVSNAHSLERWLEDWVELGEAMDEENSIRYTAMTCATDDPEREKAFLHFLENVQEPSKPLSFKLLRKYLDHPCRKDLSGSYHLFNRSCENQAALYREENVPLETEEEKLSQRFQKISGAQTVVFQGKEQTLPQMGYQEETDRSVREEAWRLTAERRLKDKDALEDLFDEMRHLRSRIADNAHFSDYRDYMFRRKERFDYGPEECEAFHLAVERFVVPVARGIQENRRKHLGLETLRPWDLSCDIDGLPPLRPFADPAELTDKVRAILTDVDPWFGERFDEMKQLGLLDLDSRKGKAPGGYQTVFHEARLPFIFMNAVGVDGDVRTLLHEGGHAMHSWLSRDIEFAPYRSTPLEFAEVASMSMELLSDPYLGAFYPDPKDAKRSIQAHLENVILLLPWIATVDAFQHWLYLNPDHTREERKATWLSLRKRFGGIEDWSGLEETQAYAWHRQLHIFEVPFYYIEYGIAQLGALQVWRNVAKDRAKGIAAYKNGLSMGSTLDLPGLFEAAGIRFDFSESTLKPLMQEVDEALRKLEA
jgi:oligoendopeptidase F